MQNDESKNDCSCGSSCSPTNKGRLTRRDFVKFTASSAALAASLNSLPAVAGPFTSDDLKHLIPSDKRLDGNWIKALYQRTSPEVYQSSKGQLKYIGMPVGGIGCGQLYLGGDGKLWLWDVFKSNYSREYDHGQRFDAMTLNGHYTKPIAQGERYHRDIGIDLEQGFSVKTRVGQKTDVRPLDIKGFKDIRFRGEYPVGKVTFADADCPVKVNLEAFSPFIPLNVKDSALPATILKYTVENTSDSEVSIQVGGWLENKICPFSGYFPEYLRRNKIHRVGENTVLHMTTVEKPKTEDTKREDVIFEDFEKSDYGHWEVFGQAFGNAPIAKDKVPNYQGDLGIKGEYAVNSHASAGQGQDVSQIGSKDGQTGRLLSPEFTISRKYIRCLIGGGKHPNKTGIRVLIDGKPVCSATGHNNNRMRTEYLNVSSYGGKTARIEIVDLVSGAWGNTGVDHIVFTDVYELNKIENHRGYGTMALTLLGQGLEAKGCAILNPKNPSGHLWQTRQSDKMEAEFSSQLIGGLASAEVTLGPGQKTEATFAVTWFFPYYPGIEGSEMGAIRNAATLKRYYAKHFDSALDVTNYIITDYDRLAGTTLLWNRTWYDSTLPHWLLDRSFISLDCLATQTAHYFDNERFWGWEGVDCCAGTCQHVWNYSQANARIFPKIERDQRANVDFGLALHASGESGHRAENGMGHFTDGQAGTIIRLWREHTTCPDPEYLREVWHSVKKAIQYLIHHDEGRDGILEGAQHNTLDAAWFGPIAWISNVYCAALAAGEQMALEMGDNDFAKTCRTIRTSGSKKLVSDLFDGEYFINKPDPNKKAINSNIGCHIDQILGQSWALQMGLPRIIPQKESVSALRSLWKYNFAPDAGLYDKLHKAIKGARVYADQGEAGMIMCTWPKGGDDKAVPGMAERVENGVTWLGPGGYFDECMTGFEYQVAAHMIYEGDVLSGKQMQSSKPADIDKSLVLKGLAVTRAVHDRYAPHKRNPYNEIECSDHYARAMASYGVFLAACGFAYHGPKGKMTFAPRLSPENFKAAFTAAEGWGTFAQAQKGKTQTVQIELKYGTLDLNQLTIALNKGVRGSDVKVTLDGRKVGVRQDTADGTLIIKMNSTVSIEADTILNIEIK